MGIAEISKMSNRERLQSMEALWDAICQDSEGLQTPEWHGRVLGERKQRLESGEAKFVSIEEARERLQR